MTQARRRHRRSYNDPGHAHELTFGCFKGYRFLARERTCQWLAESIAAARDSLGCSLWAYVFMPTHVHLIVHFPHSPYEVSQLLKEIKLPVSRRALAWLRREAPEWLPRLAQQRGGRREYHFWQRGGGFDRNILEPATLEKMIEYIHLNPVRSGLVERAVDWRWSSAGWFAGREPNSLPVDLIPFEWTIGMSGD